MPGENHLKILGRLSVLMLTLLLLVGCLSASSSSEPTLPATQAVIAATQVVPSPAPTATPTQPIATATALPAPTPAADYGNETAANGGTVGLQPEDTPTGTSEQKSLPSAQGMVRIDAGEYTLGGVAPDDYHIVFLSLPQISTPFWIDIYEVTNADYKAFVDQTGHAPPTVWPGQPQHPVRGVTWDDAVAYCTWANKRLPSEAEWEAAARGHGSDPPKYPWGNDPGAGGQVDAMPRTDTHDIGAYPFDRSPYGVYDMAGNVWEWVGDPYYPPLSENLKILRGGRFGLIEDMAFRQQTEANNSRFVPYAGFRCAADEVQGG
jgi:formylglycine-generating enzyme required for sulfatase activity